MVHKFVLDAIKLVTALANFFKKIIIRLTYIKKLKINSISLNVAFHIYGDPY